MCDESIQSDSRRFDVRLLRCMCVHVLAPIVAKAQVILRDAAQYLEALEQGEEGEEDAENERENSADADALAMLPCFFMALQRATTAAATTNGNGNGDAAAMMVDTPPALVAAAAAAASSPSSYASSSPPPPPPHEQQQAANSPGGAAALMSTPKDALAAIVRTACIAENAAAAVSLQRCADMARNEITPATGPLVAHIAISSVMLRMLAHKRRRPLPPSAEPSS